MLWKSMGSIDCFVTDSSAYNRCSFCIFLSFFVYVSILCCMLCLPSESGNKVDDYIPLNFINKLDFSSVFSCRLLACQVCIETCSINSFSQPVCRTINYKMCMCAKTWGDLFQSLIHCSQKKVFPNNLPMINSQEMFIFISCSTVVLNAVLK